jgi:leader peptidase (prepilin peptidase)/N-methyltransferase
MLTSDLSQLPAPLWHTVLAVVFVFGLLWGSFLNVVIHRVPLEESVVNPRSRCPGCKKLIRWHQNIPVLSWLFLRARCANCGMKISARYPLVELVTATLFTLSAARYPTLLAWPFHFWFLGALVACTFIDIDHWILPDKITLPGILVGLVATMVVPAPNFTDSFIYDYANGFAGAAAAYVATNLSTWLIGVLVGGGILEVVRVGYEKFAHKEGLGGGDVKFLAMVGAFLGAKGALVALILSSFVGSIVGVVLIALRGKTRGSYIQFGPFLALGALLAFFFGGDLWQWYFRF